MRLIIPAPVEEKLHSYVMAVTGEIAGMGKVKILESGDILVEDICIYDQEVTGGTADLSTEALAGFMMEKIKANESLEPWVLWWHSHANMQAFFSQRDTTTIDESTDFNHLISLVVNKRRQRECRVDVYRPFRMTEENVQVIVPGGAFVVPADIKAEVAEKVKEKVYTPPTGYGYGRYVSEGAKKVSSLLSPYLNKHASDYDENDGYVNRSAGVDIPNPDDMDANEIGAIVEAMKDRISEMENAGNGDSSECHELRMGLADWQFALAARERDDELDYLIDGE